MSSPEDTKGFSESNPDYEADTQDQVDSIIGLGSFSARKSYYPELQVKMEELREEKNRYERIFSEALSGIFQARLDGRIVVANPAMVALCRYPTADTLCSGATLADLFVDPNSYKALWEALRREESVIAFETRFRTADDVQIDVMLNASIRRTAEDAYLECFVQDVTALKEAEEKQTQLKRFETLGVFAGGIAHDFNNLLTGLFGNIEMARMQLPAGHVSARLLDSALKALDNASTLTSQLMNFAKGGEESQKDLVHLTELLRESANFILKLDKYSLVFEADENLWPVLADQGQLTQVVTNLVLNAQQAMSNGGMVTLSLNNVRDARGNPFVQISVKDHGVGIAKEDLANIFEPYFTTKKTGTGLGLASTQSIIARHDGTIEVSSRLGEGTTFVISLPAHPDARVAAEEEPEDSDQAAREYRSALVMDDEEIVRFMLAEMLREMGYEILQAADGNVAVQLYQQELDKGNPPELVVMDLVVSEGVGGWQASREIWKLNPEARIIVTSGYVNDELMAEYRSYGFAAAVAKPFRFVDLEQAVSEASSRSL